MDKQKILEGLQEIEFMPFHLMPSKDGHTHLSPGGADKLYKFIETGLETAKKEGYEESVKRSIEMAVFNIPYICKFQNTPGRLVGIVIPE